jgi:hypothetical protein
MAESGLIEVYLNALSAQLPAPIVEELADGLAQTRQRYLSRGLGPGAATRAAIAEFGEPHVITAAFTRLSPARRAARKLLATGPVVGGCWGIALITSRAWTWPVPLAARVMLGVALMSVVGLLASAAFGTAYRKVGRAGAAGCIGITVLDTTMLLLVAVTIPAIAWLVILAAAVTAARLSLTIQALRPILTS